MRWNLQNWIEGVKAKPEPVRFRYVIGCVVTSMFFVVIVWSLTVSEGFKHAATDTQKPDVSGIIPKPSDFSLDSVLSGDGSIDTTQPRSGGEFMREQVEGRSRPDIEENGITPRPEPEATSPEDPMSPVTPTP